MPFLVSPVQSGEFDRRVIGEVSAYETAFVGFASAAGVATLMEEGTVIGHNDMEVVVAWRAFQVSADLLPYAEAEALRQEQARREQEAMEAYTAAHPLAPRPERPTGQRGPRPERRSK